MDRIDKRSFLSKLDGAYYNDDNPLVNDSEYDEYKEMYIKEYGENDFNFVPGTISNEFVSYKHTYPVISLAKIKNGEKSLLEKWTKKLSPLVLEPKIDGLTIVAYPDKKGKCIYVTRGNGINGERLPNFISKYENKTGINLTGYPVRGEVFLSKSTFERINKERKQQGLNLFLNPRNAAAGILRNKERSPYIDNLSYIVYDILGNDIGTEKKIQLLINKTKFHCIEYKEIYNDYDIDTLEDKIKLYYNILSDSDMPIDGIVLKSNTDGLLNKYGMTSHHPNNEVAWKAISHRAETILRDIQWQVGRDSLTPVAIMDPVELDGTVVSKASLHNWANICRLVHHKIIKWTYFSICCILILSRKEVSVWHMQNP